MTNETEDKQATQVTRLCLSQPAVKIDTSQRMYRVWLSNTCYGFE